MRKSFNPASVKSFRFVSWTFDESLAKAALTYEFDNRYRFTEELTFHGAQLPLDEPRRSALNTCLSQLHLMAGISYYKAAVPPTIVIETAAISKQSAQFFNKLYLKGLGEFAFRNHLDLTDRVCFPFDSRCCPAPSDLKLPRRTAVPVGGGKDSAVTIDILKAASEPMLLFSVGDFEPTRQIAQQSGLPLKIVTRKLSPLLFDLNASGALNGHVPISAIIAFILPAAAVLYGFDAAVLSNERSANLGNVVSDGMEINHQYSKSLEFESDVSEYFRTAVLSDIHYFSLLRPLSDLGIARLFANLTDYHPIFLSCNAGYKIHHTRSAGWCLNCPKCRFTFLALAPFMDRDALLRIFGKNLLNDEHQQDGFDELIGIKGHKPFECVGDVRESIAAFALIARRPEWRNDRLVKRFADSILPSVPNVEALIRSELAWSETHLIPSHYFKMLAEYLKIEGVHSSYLSYN